MIKDCWRGCSLTNWKDTNLDTNLLIWATRSLRFHSQAYILTTRIPVMISFIISNRLSVTAADCWRIFPALWAANDPYATTRRKKDAPIRACHATKYQTRIMEATMSSGTNESSKIPKPTFSMAWTSLETRLIVFSEMVSSKVLLFRLRIWKWKKIEYVLLYNHRLQLFSIDSHHTETKVITLTNHKSHRKA